MSQNMKDPTKQFIVPNEGCSDTQIGPSVPQDGVDTVSMNAGPSRSEMLTPSEIQEEKAESVDGSLSCYSAPYPSSIGDSTSKGGSTIDWQANFLGSVCSYFENNALDATADVDATDGTPGNSPKQDHQHQSEDYKNEDFLPCCEIDRQIDRQIDFSTCQSAVNESPTTANSTEETTADTKQSTQSVVISTSYSAESSSGSTMGRSSLSQKEKKEVVPINDRDKQVGSLPANEKESSSGSTSHPPTTKKDAVDENQRKTSIETRKSQEEEASSRITESPPSVVALQRSSREKNEATVVYTADAVIECHSPGVERVYPDGESIVEDGTIVWDTTDSAVLQADLVIPPPQAQLVAGSENARGATDDESSAGESTIIAKWKRRTLLILLVCLVVVATASVALFIMNDPTKIDDDSEKNIEWTESSMPVSEPVSESSLSPTSAPNSSHPLLPTLHRIQDRGYVICRGDPDELKQGFGFSIDMCSAIAAAVLDDPLKYEMLKTPFQEMFIAIANGDVDISTSQTTLTVDRDIHESSSHQGMAFSTPYFYYGTVFYGIPEYVDCADRGETVAGSCRNLTVCVLDRSVYSDFVRLHLRGSATQPVQFTEEMFTRLKDGRCNVIAGSRLAVHEHLNREESTQEELKNFIISSKFHGRDPKTLTTRNDDAVFSDLVNWLLRALIQAEAMNITKESAHLFPSTLLFGEAYTHMFRNAIAAVGNYGDMYNRAWGQIERLPGSINTPHVQRDDAGLLYPYPWGNIDQIDGTLLGPIPNGTLDNISHRHKLSCGVLLGRPGLAEFNGMGLDVDYCRVLSAALFAGDTKSVSLIPIGSLGDGFLALASGEIDVLSGAVYNMENDVREPLTGVGYAFSEVYYYYESPFLDTVLPLAMATREDDPQWTDFVRTMVSCTIHAEASAIASESASQMPTLELFGPTYRQALQDVVYSIGNYAEIYSRNMEQYLPRANNTRNTLNTGTSPLFYSIWKF